eukprot:s653_g3.t1
MDLGVENIFDWSSYFRGVQLKTDSHLNNASNEYSEEELKLATENFDRKCLLGAGSFGKVYKGTMRDGTEVAIKVLQVPNEGGFEDEVQVLSRFRHPNLVILMGFARHAETGWRSLIYEFLSGGDAAKRIARSRHSMEPFSARARVSTALDAACGLSHLHNMTPRAFHRDIKSQNILLDKNGTAKMADFGLACLSSASKHKVLRVGGTVGYACPEYLRSGVITEGCEVYSFGMVLLELLTAAPPAVAYPDRPKEYQFLVDYVQGSSEKVQQMLDPSAGFPTKVFEALCAIAFRCINPRSCSRPFFKQLVEELRHLLADGFDGIAISPTSAPSAARPARPTAALCVGAAVEARWQGGLQWYQGWILRLNNDHTAAVRYNDGQLEDFVPMHFLRPQGSYRIASQVAGPTTVVTPLPSCMLKCLYAEGVTVELQECVRSVPDSLELVVGRTAQPPSFWDSLVPEKDLQSRVSRQHFKILCRQLQLPDGQSHPVLFLQCLSPNGIVLNGRFLGPDAGEQRIQDKDAIALATCRASEGAMSEPVSDASVATAALWTVPALKPFLIFEIQVPDFPRKVERPEVEAALADLKRERSHSSGGGYSQPLLSASMQSVRSSRSKALESFATQKGSVLCESPILKFLRSSMGS